jgi:hypothetical protein
LPNPHNFPASKFALKAEEKDKAICCDSSKGPFFVGGIAVSCTCNANTGSYTDYFGCSYVNNTGLYAEIVFTGSGNFTVKEIEVFEITG